MPLYFKKKYIAKTKRLKYSEDIKETQKSQQRYGICRLYYNYYATGFMPSLQQSSGE